jgi:hypothetical protein
MATKENQWVRVTPPQTSMISPSTRHAERGIGVTINRVLAKLDSGHLFRRMESDYSLVPSEVGIGKANFTRKTCTVDRMYFRPTRDRQLTTIRISVIRSPSVLLDLVQNPELLLECPGAEDFSEKSFYIPPT